jgi:5-methylcytosine-specific restriction enzyme subunit McrC
MKLNKTIQVFEHGQLLINDHGFARHHWEALGWYNGNHGGSFYTLTPKGVKFNQYVGVIQVGNITIEILPKISNTVEKGDKAKWQRVLIDMLRECRWMQVHAQDKASLRFKPNSILEVYLELFVHECEEIVRAGLLKKYRLVEANCTALKGKLLFGSQIQHNLIHKEHFYTRHHVFDRENIFNQILFKALKLIPILSQSPFLKDRVYRLLLSFPDLSDIKVTASTFEKLVYNRKTIIYKEAIDISAMLLLNFRPDITTGNNHVLAILFDMNDLWEEYIQRQIFKSKPTEWMMKTQNSKCFWKLSYNRYRKTIRPDIVIHDLLIDKKIILDTKWKLPENNLPADADLKQMFVYNEHWNGMNALLVYPHGIYTKTPLYLEGKFEIKERSTSTHKCGILKMAVLDINNNLLDKTIGKRITAFLKCEILK